MQKHTGRLHGFSTALVVDVMKMQPFVHDFFLHFKENSTRVYSKALHIAPLP